MFSIRIFGCIVLLGTLFAAVSSSASNKKFPIVYDKGYNYGTGLCVFDWFIKKLHPFDIKKSGNVVHALCRYGIDKKMFHKPIKVTDEELELVHTKAYLSSLKKNDVVASIAEVWPLSIVPDCFNSLLQWFFLNPMRLATGGTQLATELALKNKKSTINLGGGYHHAKKDSGEGFCFFADVPFAVKNLWKKNPNLKVMVVDLDAHRGNGIASIFKDDKRISIFDVYGDVNYPRRDNFLRRYIKYNWPLRFFVKDKPYHEIVDKHLKKAVKKSKPDLIIYNAGTDILDGDPLGRFRISKKGVVKRDELVFEAGKQKNIPVCMLLSGGYTNESAIVIADSIKNLIDKKYIEAA